MDEQTRLNSDLSRIEPLQSQAKVNLTGHAKELWVAGIRNLKEQHQVLSDITEKIQATNNKKLINTHRHWRHPHYFRYLGNDRYQA